MNFLKFPDSGEFWRFRDKSSYDDLEIYYSQKTARSINPGSYINALQEINAQLGPVLEGPIRLLELWTTTVESKGGGHC